MPSVVTGQTGMEDRNSTTLLLCVAGVYCWEIALGIADPWNVIFYLSCWFILGFSCAYSLCSKDSFSVVVFCYMLMCVGCFGLVVSTCQVIDWKDPSEDTLTWWGDYLHKAQVEEWCVFFFSLDCLCSYVPPALHNIYFIRPWHDIAYLCWKCR